MNDLLRQSRTASNRAPKTLFVIVGVVMLIALALLLLERRPGYGVYYGIAKLTGSPVDVGLVGVVVEADPHRSQVHAGVVTGQIPSAGRRVGVGSRVWIWVGPDRAEPDDGPGNGGGGWRPRLPLGPRSWSPTGLKPTPR